MDINLLIEPKDFGSPVESASAVATRAYTQYPAYASTSPMYTSASPAYATSSPTDGVTPVYLLPRPTLSASMQGEQEMGARAIARTRDYATHPPWRAFVAPATPAQVPPAHGLTPTKLVPNLLPPAPQQHQAPPPSGPFHSYHHVPPQLSPTPPQIHPRSETDLISGAQTAPAPQMSPNVKRGGEEDSDSGESEVDGSEDETLISHCKKRRRITSIHL